MTSLTAQTYTSMTLGDRDLVNEWGSLRLCKVQSAFGYDSKIHKQETLLDTNFLTEIYTRWRDLKEVVPIKYVYQDKELRYLGSDAQKYVNGVYAITGHLYSEHKGYVTIPKEVNEWKFPIAVKRGNEQYIRIIKDRMAPFLQQEPITFFDRSWGVKKTNMLYVTLTVDPAYCGNDMGYLDFGTWFNSWITNLRNQFGDLVYIRAWQSQESGYCHAHALIYFIDTEFTAVYWKPDNSFRLPSRSKVRSAIKKAWRWGNCDIICVDNTQDAFKDLLKYVTRDLEGGESDLTNALLWYFRRQAFAISRNFAEVVWGEPRSIDLAEPGNADLIEPNMCNSNLPLIRIEIFPMIRQDLFSKAFEIHNKTLMEPPPITESDAFLLERLVMDCDMVECSRNEEFDCPVFMYVRRN